jgi:hypothetical protein
VVNDVWHELMNNLSVPLRGRRGVPGFGGSVG